MKPGGSGFIFECSGRDVYANRGIIGINPDLETSEGYDGGLPWDEPLTKAERIELADYMIALWTRYREAEPEKAMSDD